MTSKKNNFDEEIEQEQTENGNIKETKPIQAHYKTWFLDYASYVILERAVPALDDGLKPVQRRILHSMKQMDDGRFNKAANIIGHTMQYHPHGDAAIAGAIVTLGQKDLLIETQGNWGDIRTGDSAAAPRYIEARLSKFALEVAFNPQTTEWQFSYDGRKKEPVHLPLKFPLLLAQGAEGIAVGLATKIMPHNFNELIDASIDILHGREVDIFPDFPTGGFADFSNYNQGMRGGRIRLRAIIEAVDKKTLVIRSVPFGTTTTALLDSIVKASENNKIKIKKIVDNTAKDVEMLVELPAGVSPDVTIDALYAFTDCELSISPNCCVIREEKPAFLSVNELLRLSTERTKMLLKWELENKKAELSEKLFFSSLEKIFIEERIYHDIEECETWESVLTTIDRGLEPFKKQLLREVTEDDLIRLTEIKIKRISKFNTFKADELMRSLEEEIAQVKHDLKHLTEYAAAYFMALKNKYGKGRERKTEIRSFDNIQVAKVAVANRKLYVNRSEGFIGTELKKDEFVSECSDIDDIIVFLRSGRFIVTKVSGKAFVGKNILHVAVWKKGDDRLVYNLIYYDSLSGKSFAKRFTVTSIIRDKAYDITKGGEKSKILYFTANPNSESEIVTVYLNPASRARKKVFEFDFGTLAIKGRGAGGNTLTRYPVRRIVQKEAGGSTLGGLDVYFDENVGRLNTDKRGVLLGSFDNGDLILALYSDGTYELSDYDLNNHYDIGRLKQIEKFNPETIISAVHYDGGEKNFYVKRFKIEKAAKGRSFRFISESKGSSLIAVATTAEPIIELEYLKGRSKEKITERIELNILTGIKGQKARGNRLSRFQVTFADIINAQGNSPEPGTAKEEQEQKQEASAPTKKETGDKKADQLKLF